MVQRAPVKRDYLEREARNRSLGLAGELLVMDGAGYDILSFDTDGRERFIEVKTRAAAVTSGQVDIRAPPSPRCGNAWCVRSTECARAGINLGARSHSSKPSCVFTLR